MKIPVRVRLAALKRAQVIKTSNPDVLAVGWGWKHSRRHGYGSAPQQAVKFVVQRKQRRQQQLPKRIAVRVGGKLRFVPTDVEHMHGLAHHLMPFCDCPGQGKGTPSFFVGQQKREYLITAGHVVCPVGQRRPNAATLFLRTSTKSLAVGKVDLQNTFFCPTEFPTCYVDIATVDVSNIGGQAFELLKCPPFDTMAGVVPVKRIAQAYDENRMLIFQICSPQLKDVLVTLDMQVSDDPFYFRLTEGHVTYAPVMLHFRVYGSGSISEGDSGAPLIDNQTNEVVGLHVIGMHGGGNESWAVAAESALSNLSLRLGHPVRVLAT